MKHQAQALWAKHDHHKGDRWRLFTAVGAAIDARSVFYPGSYADIALPFVFPAVTYLDTDKRTPRFFGDTVGVAEVVAHHAGPANPDISFIHPDYTGRLDLPDRHFDLLVSRSGDYRVRTTDLDTYLIPKKAQDITIDALHGSRRGIGYTRSPFAYLFTGTG